MGACCSSTGGSGGNGGDDHQQVVPYHVDLSVNMQVTGKRRALLVGINYVGSRAELRGCINDVNNQKRVLIEHYGFKEEEIRMINEDQPRECWPYKENIMNGLKWLYEGANSGDLLCFQYSGHGSQYEGQDGVHDCICPLDCLEGSWPASVICDWEIHESFYSPLPSGCMTVALFDCCHSGTVANLVVKRDVSASAEQQPKARYMAPPASAAPKASRALGGIRKKVMSEQLSDHRLWVFSGCQDDQTSADAYCDGTYQGAFTWALIKALKEDIWNQSYLDLLAQIKSNLRGYTQCPALTTTHSCFLESWYMSRQPTSVKPDDSMNQCTGKRHCLLIGCNYRNTPFELRGCINDVINQKRMLMEHYGFCEEDMVIMTEDADKSLWPYKENIVRCMKQLVERAKSGDLCYLAYSGHGSQVEDQTGTVAGGMSDVICPLDCDQPWPEHVICDTEIHRILYDELPAGVKLVCNFDCCHSGTVANLDVIREMGLGVSAPETYQRIRYLAPPAGAGGSKTTSKAKGAGLRSVLAKKDGVHCGKAIWVFSGCQDNQTSADAYEDNQYQGAMTWALCKVLQQHRFHEKYGDTLQSIRAVLHGKYSQIPACSTTAEENFQCWFLAKHTPDP